MAGFVSLFDSLFDSVFVSVFDSPLDSPFDSDFPSALPSLLLSLFDELASLLLFFAPASFVEGWAHYCEQMMVEAGFRKKDPTLKVGQLAESLVRLVRFIVGIKLHCEDLSVEQGMRYFRDEAFLEEATARREAERGTFDPTYLVYSAGKLMMLKLRNDYKDRQTGKFSLKTFHDAVLSQGSAPFWAHRQLLLGDNTGTVLE